MLVASLFQSPPKGQQSDRTPNFNIDFCKFLRLGIDISTSNNVEC